MEFSGAHLWGVVAGILGVAGAIAGARSSVEAIPSRWLTSVNRSANRSTMRSD